MESSMVNATAQMHTKTTYSHH